MIESVPISEPFNGGVGKQGNRAGFVVVLCES